MNIQKIWSHKNNALKNRLVSALLFFMMLCVPGKSWAASLVTARYLQTQGTEIVVKIMISAPPPPTLIIMQKLPPGIVIQHAQPRVKSQNPARGEAKWLLVHVRPGTLTLRMILNNTVTSDAISGEIRYREPKAGTMAIVPILKK